MYRDYYEKETDGIPGGFFGSSVTTTTTTGNTASSGERVRSEREYHATMFRVVNSDSGSSSELTTPDAMNKQILLQMLELHRRMFALTVEEPIGHIWKFTDLCDRTSKSDEADVNGRMVLPCLIVSPLNCFREFEASVPLEALTSWRLAEQAGLIGLAGGSLNSFKPYNTRPTLVTSTEEEIRKSIGSWNGAGSRALGSPGIPSDDTLLKINNNTLNPVKAVGCESFQAGIDFALSDFSGKVRVNSGSRGGVVSWGGE